MRIAIAVRPHAPIYRRCVQVQLWSGARHDPYPLDLLRWHAAWPRLCRSSTC